MSQVPDFSDNHSVFGENPVFAQSPIVDAPSLRAINQTKYTTRIVAITSCNHDKSNMVCIPFLNRGPVLLEGGGGGGASDSGKAGV